MTPPVVTKTSVVRKVQGLPEKTNEVLWDQLEEVAQEVENTSTSAEITIQTVVGVSSSLSLGYLVWVLRGGALLTSLLTNMPAWQLFDPMPILESWEGGTSGQRVGVADKGSDKDDDAERKLREMIS